VSDGGLYGHRIRHIRREGAATQVATLAGGNEWFFQDGPGGQARFATPCGLVVVGAGSSSYVLYVADRDNNRIRKVSVLGASVTVSTLAGITVAGYQDGMAAAAQFYEPVGLAMDAAGLIYVADVANDAIRVITPP
jgi:DNA-binding beta-propeller fold protein YncE